jgi:hypothetical protein
MPRYSWKNNIKVEFKGIKCEGIDWIQLAQDRVHWWDLVNTVTLGFHIRPNFLDS